MPEQWYWKHRGDLLGPLDTDVLADLIRKRRISDRDQIRLATNDQWMTGAEVKALFAEGQHNTAEAAAALLNRAIRPQLARDAEPGAGPGALDAAATGVKAGLQRVLGAIGGIGGPISHLGSLALSRALEGGELLFRLLTNRLVILAAVAIAFNVIVFVQHRQGSDARNRTVLTDLTAAWDQWQSLSNDDAKSAARGDLQDAILRRWDATLQSLTSDAKREALPSSNPFADSQRQKSIAAARRSLIQAIQEFLLVVRAPADAPRSTADFETFLQSARSVMDNNYKYYTPKWTPQTAERFQSEIAAALDPWMAAVIMLDAGLVVVILWTRIRSRRR